MDLLRQVTVNLQKQFVETGILEDIEIHCGCSLRVVPQGVKPLHDAWSKSR